jgi:hypothetical protein
MSIRKRLILLVVLSMTAVLSAAGQSLFDNAYHRRALELQRLAERNLEDGEYDESIRLSREAGIFADLSAKYGEMLYHRYKADNGIRRANERLTYARGIEADRNFPSEYSDAIRAFENARQLFSEGEAAYRAVNEYLRNAEAAVGTDEFEIGIAKYSASEATAMIVDHRLKDIRIVVREAPKPVEEPEVIVLALPSAEPVFPQFYTVRLIPELRDCFWRIAEYDFIFGDRAKWPLLYELNKDKLKDPNNPHLIHPGQVFEIPSLKGEKREGMYDPSVTYPSIKDY